MSDFENPRREYTKDENFMVEQLTDIFEIDWCYGDEGDLYSGQIDTSTAVAIVEARFPKMIWICFNINPGQIDVINDAKLFNFLTEGGFDQLNQVPFTYDQLWAIVFEHNLDVLPVDLTLAGLELESQAAEMSDKFDDVFPPELLEMIDFPFIPVDRIQLLGYYLLDPFPIYFPTQLLIKVKLAEYLTELSNTISPYRLWWGSHHRRVYCDVQIGENVDGPLAELQKLVPVIDIKKDVCGIVKYTVINDVETYRSLWEQRVAVPFLQRKAIEQLARFIPIQALVDLTIEYWTPEEGHPQPLRSETTNQLHQVIPVTDVRNLILGYRFE